ncbi:putative 7-dehydrocholesterol reductase [Cotonvirus japonicus]|uniref:7-dehydrocholesterol reductase n=1 Tax=Cotonvirus japonicus TaxID=2811091 RepID=A0ABM7NT67_9VIRU|nr:putative 7-dehydrocholesterol reductase [Cotonvirus japonicus]BCS83368.1 putative 7-dehydrocholesterol reductase [Cotonvirus japonicus]
MNWGRNNKPTIKDSYSTIFMFTLCPFIVLIFYMINYGHYEGCTSEFVSDIINLDYDSVKLSLPHFKFTTLIALLLWIIFQFILFKVPDILHKFIPNYRGGLQRGHITPAGYQLYYEINGLQSWIITHLIFGYLWYNQIINPTIITENWGSIFVSANIIGYIITIMAYYKAKYYSSHPKDNKETGYFFYDLVMGIEFNPRIYGNDLKLFFNGRPGIIAWNIINLSFAASQYEKFGYVTNSMFLVIILQGIYIIDFFYNENWYIHTIDIAHDHFGWMLAWGDTVWLPFMYTLQAGYLSNNPVELDNWMFYTVLTIGLIGYAIFRIANHQKDKYRNNIDGTVKYIHCKYTTSDGHEYASKLVYSGLWGLSRHMNYTGDIILSTAYCLACGFNDIIPYFYCIYMTILLVIRCFRDEQRLSRKYGLYWNVYTQVVPYRFIPYVY